jgi:hypothetical protein
LATPSQQFTIDKSFFHSLSRVNTSAGQYSFESTYPDGHSVKAGQVWADTVPFASTIAAADANVLAYPTIIKKYTLQLLTEVPGSNGEAWYINDAGIYAKDWIAPTDVLDSGGAFSAGYTSLLYQNSGTFIPPTAGVFVVNFFGGLVLFQTGSTPADLGYGIPKITAYRYIGQNLSTVTGSINDAVISTTTTWSSSKIDPSLSQLRTTIDITGLTTAGTSINITASGASWTKSEDTGDLTSSGTTFNSHKRIRIMRNGQEQKKGTEVSHVNNFNLSFSSDLYTGEQLLVYT